MRYVALLRGINVGGKNAVPMKRLAEIFELLSFTGVRTYIQSGNVVFDTKKESVTTLATRIESAIERTMGFPVRTVVFTRSQFLHIAGAVPQNWKNDHEDTAYVLFLWKKYDSKRVLDELEITEGIDTVLYVKGAVLWYFKKKQYARSGMHKILGTPFYAHCTSRNVNTVRKLAMLVE